MSTRFQIPTVLFLMLALVLSACGGGAATESSSAAADSAQSEDQSSTEAEAPEAAPTEEQAAPTEPPLPPLPPERQAVEIITEDGRVLEGYYYPAAINPAPIVVLMHWAGGDLEDWREIAPWLQNRAGEMGSASVAAAPAQQGSETWLDPSWFPMMPPDVSFGVLVFNFGDFGNSEPGNISAGAWAEDARAAMAAAAELEGANPHQLAALGASIGADGSVDGCYLYNMGAEVDHCQGALSLSPGNYLTDQFTYAEAVEYLDGKEKPVWCLSSEGDTYSLATCETARGTYYQTIYYPMSYHGMELIQPDYLPSNPELGVDTMVTIQDFLEAVFGVTIN